VEASIRNALDGRKGDERVLDEAREMRVRLLDANAGDRKNPWSLKYATGGLMEIEFLVQTGTLLHGLDQRAARAAVPELAKLGWLTEAEAETLDRALALMQRLQQIERVALDSPIDPASAGEGLRRAMARYCGEPDFEALEARLAGLQGEAAAVAERVFGGG
jgi:glutamate-ammonia-ligase adenylyltransferase